MSHLRDNARGELDFQQYDLPEPMEHGTFVVGCSYANGGKLHRWGVAFQDNARPYDFESVFRNVMESMPRESSDFKAGTFMCLLNLKHESLTPDAPEEETLIIEG